MTLKQKILKVFKDEIFGSLGTINSDGKPWVRYMGFTASDDLTIQTPTYLNTRKIKEIKANPDVHFLCGCTSVDPSNASCYCQVQGIAHIETDNAEKKKYWLPHFESYFVNGPEDPNFGIIIIKPYRIECVDGTTIDIWEADKE
jgi:general stress protein 26